jgi:hypothetical protein
MKIVKLSVEAVEGGHVLSISAFIQSNEELQADDVAGLLERLREGAGEGTSAVASETDANAGNGSSTPRRRRGASAGTNADAETSPSAPKEDAGSATGAAPSRRRGGSSAPAEEKPAAKTISNIDLAKAMAKFGEACGKDEAMDWLKENYGVEKVADLKPEDRESFLTAVAEVTG